MKRITPSVRETAFNCPHCEALTRQYWYSVHAEPMEKDHLPYVIEASDMPDQAQFSSLQDADQQALVSKWFRDKADGAPFLYAERTNCDYTLENVWVSRCYNCNSVTIWKLDRVMHPQKGEAPPPNVDLPVEIKQDYAEASSILSLSPRGAAALVRLAIQKLCKHLGQPGENINSDIKALVAGGLDPRVQRALDAVRVIGNNAVHPGKIDLKDDRATAESLFRLLNLIAEKMISEPNHVDEVYSMLPESVRKAIEQRDKGGA